MQTINILDHLKVEIADDLPRKAIQSLRALGKPEAIPAASNPLTLRIRGTFSGTRPENCLKADHYAIGPNFLEASSIYKFSRWKYRLSWSSPTTLDMEVKGDFCSAWVWPTRIVPQIIRLLLQRRGFYFFHATGLYNGKDAVILFAPSGTGKTLTTLHFLCSGGKIYNDDLVAWKEGKLYATTSELHFWAKRYEKTPDVLPENLPAFHADDRRRMRLYAVIHTLTNGLVALGASLKVEKYWRNSAAPAAPVAKMFALQKQRPDAAPQETDVKVLLQKLKGDLLFQNLTLIRIMEIERLTGVTVLNCGEFFHSYNVTFDELAQKTITPFFVPQRYSRAVFDKLYSEVMK